MLERVQAGNLTEVVAVGREWLSGRKTSRFSRLEIDLPVGLGCEIPLFPKVSWRSRGGGLTVNAWGAALQLDLKDWVGESTVFEELGVFPGSDLANSLRWFIWGRFDSLFETPAAGADTDGKSIDEANRWHDFGTRRLLLPAVELRRENGREFLGLNSVLEGVPKLQKAWEGVSLPVATGWQEGGEGPSVSREDWARQMSQVQSAMSERSSLKKVVLARWSRFGVPEFPPVEFLRTVGELQPNSYLFRIEPVPGSAFFGASPEQLFHRQERKILSEALAGTRPRGHSVAGDQSLGQELLRSKKDLEEQRLVLNQIVEKLGPLVGDLEVDTEPRIRRLREVQHLCSTVGGELVPRLHDGHLLAALHPTPAVAGYPGTKAMKVISEVEEFDRGLYAGPFGCCSARETEVAVAIRSALWQDGVLDVFAGAGILPESSADSEWDETEAKMQLMRQLITGAHNEV
ncbi:MAG: isochorismate synthase [Gemmatimonadales bacterium]|nr:isochorismate synthase [Gemmatimonadales bacterium]